MSDEWTVERHLEAGSENSRSVAKTTITFKGPKRGFAGARPKGFEAYRIGCARMPAGPACAHTASEESAAKRSGRKQRQPVGCGNR
jgi:hypothetical protein